MSIEVADLVASLGLDATKYDAGMVAAEARAKTGAATLRFALGGIGLGATAALAEMIKKAADFQSVTQTLANNTNMGAAGLAQMRDGVLQLARQTGQPLESLSQGWMHITNHAYNGAAALNIATAAAKNAAATGGDAADDMNVLAGVMREYGVSSAQAAKDTGLATRYLDVLHNAVANSNFTMKDFTEGAKRAFATAGAFGVPISQVTAQLAILSEHGFPTAAVASLNWAGMLRSLESPTHQAMKGMQSLSAVTGVNLVADIKKLQQNGAFLPQFLDDIQKATGGDFNKIRALMPQSSYATALMGLVRAREELHRVQGLTDDALAGRDTGRGMVGTNEAFNAWSKTANAQMAILRGTIEGLSVQLGSVFLPALNRVLQAAMPWVQALATWVSGHQKLAAGILAGVAALGTLAGGMAVIGALSAPLAALIGAISLPLLAVAAAAAGLALAWQNDWGGIREKVASAWSAIQPILRAIGNEFQALRTVFSIGGLGAVWDVLKVQFSAFGQWLTGWAAGVAPMILPRLAELAGQLGGWIRSVGAPALITHLQSWAAALWGWVRQAWPPLLREAGALATRLWGWITGTALPGIRTHLQDWGTAFWHWVQPAATALIGHMPALLSRLGTWITDAVQTLGPKLAHWVGAFWHWVREVGPPLMRELAALVSKVGIYAVGAAAKFAIWLVPKLPDLITGFGALLLNIGVWFGTKALPELWAFGNDMATALVQGILDTIGQLGPQIAAALGREVQKAMAQIPGAQAALGALDAATKSLSGLIGGGPPAPLLNPYLSRPTPNPLADTLGPLGITAFRNLPFAASPAVRPVLEGARTSHTTINVHVTPTGVHSTGDTATHRALGDHVGKAVDEALRQLAGAGGHGAGGHFLPGTG